MEYGILKFIHILGVVLMGAGLIGVWMADLRSRQLRELKPFAEAVRNIAVFYDGHPPHVFATDRVSNHHVGRAVDIWAVDGRTVASLRGDTAFLDPVLVLAAQLGATEIGSPYDRNGPQGGYFTDDAHQDHLHVGVSAGRPAVVP